MTHHRTRRVALGLVAVATLATIGATGVDAATAPLPPYPDVAVPPGACKTQQEDVTKAQEAYDKAKKNYDVSFGLPGYGGYPPNGIELGQVERQLAAATIALSNARNLLAQCANLAGAQPSVCVAIALDLNRLRDQAALRNDELRAIARQRAFLEGLPRGAISEVEYTNKLAEFDAAEARVRDALTFNAALTRLYNRLAAVFACPAMLRPVGNAALPAEGDVSVAVATEPIEEFVSSLDEAILDSAEVVMAPFIVEPDADQDTADLEEWLANLGDEPASGGDSGDLSTVVTQQGQTIDGTTNPSTEELNTAVVGF